MERHWGEIIEKRLEEVGMTKAEFGRRINTSRQNVNTLLRKQDLAISLLESISRVLGTNFFDRLQQETETVLGRKPKLKEKSKPERDFRILLEIFSGDELNEYLQWRKSREE